MHTYEKLFCDFPMMVMNSLLSQYNLFVQAFASDPLADLDKVKTDILMYCTGGIRCDVYSTILR